MILIVAAVMRILYRIKKAIVSRIARSRREVRQLHLLEGQISLQARHIEVLLNRISSLVEVAEERTRVIEDRINYCCEVVDAAERRTVTLQHQSTEAKYLLEHIQDFSLSWYLELQRTQGELPLAGQKVVSESIRLETSYPLAVDSNDYINPESTVEGVVRPRAFVEDCVTTLGAGISILDVGAGAGGLVYECLWRGVFAIGLEGSDYCKRNKVGYWPLIERNLLLADITKPFRILRSDDSTSYLFDVVTIWEVLEHINEKDIPQLLESLFIHLQWGGYIIGSISLIPYDDKDGNPYHVTLRPWDWWKEKFEQAQFIIPESHPFNEATFCRGIGGRYQDIHDYRKDPDKGILFVAKKLRK